MSKDKVHIKIWLTKKSKLIRVKITEADSYSYEVTVGGQEWEKGKGKQYKQQILTKIDAMSMRINSLRKMIENE